MMRMVPAKDDVCMNACSLHPSERDDSMVEQLLHACMPVILPESSHSAAYLFASAVASLLADEAFTEHLQVSANVLLPSKPWHACKASVNWGCKA